MRVNSVFTNLFSHYLMVKSGIVIVLLALLFIASSFTKHSDHELRVKQVNLVIRQIGHRLLLQSGDSVSRVLPVTELKGGTFVLRFENEFVFNHDSLVVLSQDLLPKTQFPSGYMVTVHDCIKAGIVYGFQITNNARDILACRGRSEPQGCYLIEFAFPDLYDTEEQKKTAIEHTEEPKSIKVSNQEAIAKLEEVTAAIPSHTLELLREEAKSVKADHQEVNSKIEELKTTTFGYPLSNMVYTGMLVLLGVTLLIGRFGKISTPLPNQSHTITKVPVSKLTELGKFSFDVKGKRLLFESEVISLTDKECKILGLLNNSFGELILRETLMEKIWINEGVITGRSLDMFVSKLRKKLSSDPELRITNVHGKGYILEIPGV